MSKTKQQHVQRQHVPIVWQGKPSLLNLWKSVGLALVITVGALAITGGNPEQQGTGLLVAAIAWLLPLVDNLWRSGTTYTIDSERLTVRNTLLGATVALHEAELHKVTDWQARSNPFEVVLNILSRRGYGTLLIATRERYEREMVLGSMRGVYEARDLLRGAVEDRKTSLGVHRHEDMGG